MSFVSWDYVASAALWVSVAVYVWGDWQVFRLRRRLRALSAELEQRIAALEARPHPFMLTLEPSPDRTALIVPGFPLSIRRAAIGKPFRVMQDDAEIAACDTLAAAAAATLTRAVALAESGDYDAITI